MVQTEHFKPTEMAFLIAPLWVPSVVAALFVIGPVIEQMGGTGYGPPNFDPRFHLSEIIMFPAVGCAIFAVAAVYSYVSMIVLGLPIFFALRAFKLLGPRTLSGSGAISGVTAERLLHVTATRGILGTAGDLAFFATLGGLVGFTFWRIAKSDFA